MDTSSVLLILNLKMLLKFFINKKLMIFITNSKSLKIYNTFTILLCCWVMIRWRRQNRKLLMFTWLLMKLIITCSPIGIFFQIKIKSRSGLMSSLKIWKTLKRNWKSSPIQRIRFKWLFKLLRLNPDNTS